MKNIPDRCRTSALGLVACTPPLLHSSRCSTLSIPVTGIPHHTKYPFSGCQSGSHQPPLSPYWGPRGRVQPRKNRCLPAGPLQRAITALNQSTYRLNYSLPILRIESFSPPSIPSVPPTSDELGLGCSRSWLGILRIVFDTHNPAT